MSVNEKMKDSGVEWIGEIPEGWEVVRLKDVCEKTGTGTTPLGGNEEAFSDDGVIPWIRPPELNFSTVSHVSGRMLSSMGVVDAKVARAGTLFICGIGSLGKSAIAKIPATCNQQINFFSLNKKANLSWSLYLSVAMESEWGNISPATTLAICNKSKMSNFYIPLPPLAEQKAIADFLDRETGLIDKRLALIDKKRGLLNELRKSVVHEAVTKGLEKGVAMKDSGVEWIGEIPAGWEVSRLKSTLFERQGKNADKNGTPITENILSVMKDIGVINYEDKGNVGNKKSEDVSGYKLVKQGDLVVNKMNILIGSCGISPEDGALSVVYLVLREKFGHMKYWGYIFSCRPFQIHLRTIAKGILEIREAVDMDLFWQLILPCPSYSEQNAIADFLDRETGLIDKMLSLMDRQEALLKEQRKALVHEVVTGKLRVI